MSHRVSLSSVHIVKPGYKSELSQPVEPYRVLRDYICRCTMPINTIGLSLYQYYSLWTPLPMVTSTMLYGTLISIWLTISLYDSTSPWCHHDKDDNQSYDTLLDAGEDWLMVFTLLYAGEDYDKVSYAAIRRGGLYSQVSYATLGRGGNIKIRCRSRII